ncbi:MAG: hypothetical protein J2P38_01870 [Candidatus Dormibacteraeota bacterium]|nr:hypothetical protein [Candidatus Dormibacteraeota bacterium]
MNPFFEDFVRVLAEEAEASGHTLPNRKSAVLESQLTRALLDLTRVVAHSQERRFGPLVAYLTGAALAGTGLDDAAAAALVDRVASRLEKDTPSE